MATRIYNRWKGYTVADCDCRYCLYYGGRKHRNILCRALDCVCKDEIKEAALRERNENGSQDQS